jgi:hypothetical protein
MMDFLKRKKVEEKKSGEDQALRGASEQDVYRAGAFEGDPPMGSFYAPATGSPGFAASTTAGTGGYAGSKGVTGNV